MDFELTQEQQMIKDLVEKFVSNELMPLESRILQRETEGKPGSLTDEETSRLTEKCREIGLWGLDVPQALGGAELDAVSMVGVNEEIKRTITPFTFPPDSPNLHMLMSTVNEDQRKRYLDPYARGEVVSAIAISEPGAGADPAGMITRAVKDGDDWVINGRKIWVSRVPESAFTILMALTDPEKKQRGGITAFIVDKGTPGFEIEREIPMIGGNLTYELRLDNLRLPDSQILGKVGDGFGPMQLRLTVRRLQMGAWCVGIARRALDMLVEQASQRVTFGAPLSDRQTVQNWVADASIKIHACRLMVLDAAWKQDQGRDVRQEASMVKLYATEMAQEIIDQAMQAYGAMGMTKELPLQYMANQVRVMRIYEGPSEIHRWVIARQIFREHG